MSGPQNSLPDKPGDWSTQTQAHRPWSWLARLVTSSEPALDPLDRALAAGLMLEVMLENPHLTDDSGPQGQRLKACLRTTLATQLAGRMPLASFQRLAQGLDRWFGVIYPQLAGAGLTGPPHAPARVGESGGASLLREDLFYDCLKKSPDLLPRRRHRKIDPDKLWQFLAGTGGGWFRLRDFEEHFQMDRKTAWEYAQKLLQAGLLVHNQGHSSAVRYRVAPRFLKPAGALQLD